MPDLDFDANDIPPAESFEPVPAGWYSMTVESSEKRETKNGRGSYIQLELEVMDGPYQGRKIWDRLNLWNENEQAVSIAKRQLSSLCHAAGRINIKRTEELHGIPVMAKVALRPAKGDYDASNDIKAYKPTETAAKSRGQAQAQASSGAAPWQK